MNESIVLITGDRDEMGTGFVIYEDEANSYVLTCAHVVEDVCKESILVNGLNASVIAQGSSSLDLAVLRVKRLKDKLPCLLWTAANSWDSFTTSGFYYFGESIKKNIRVAEITGQLERKTTLSTVQGIPLDGWDLIVKSEDVLESGCSGAPVFNQQNRVIAMVTHKLSDGKKGAAISVKEIMKLENWEVDIRPWITFTNRPWITFIVPTFKFEVVTLGAQGYVLERRNRQAEYRREDLDNNIFLDLVAIPAGSFQMGSTSSDEQPVHRVKIASFLMGRYPVTQAQWKAVAAFPKVKCDLDPDPALFKGSDCPVEQISWREAVEFCDRLSRKTNCIYRLPSEAEWEYACRAKTTKPFHFGETITTDFANYDGNESYRWYEPEGECRWQTTPVGSFGVANAFGLYDMHGNVWEWCADHWHGNYDGAPTDGSAWLTEHKGSYRLMRGGSWKTSPWLCRSDYRGYFDPVLRDDDLGFRVVCGLA